VPIRSPAVRARHHTHHRTLDGRLHIEPAQNRDAAGTGGGQGRAEATTARAPASTGRDAAADDDETGDSRKRAAERTEKDDRSSGDRGGGGDSTGDDESDGSAPRQAVVHEGQDDEPRRGSDSDEGRDSGSRALRAAESQARVPGDLIELADWYLTLPTGKPGDPDTIENPQLATFTNDAFKLNDRRDGVVFSARADGVTTKNSHFPRSELREMTGSEKAAWSNTSGTHTLDVCEAVTKAPAGKPEVVAAQIHDGNDDVMQIRLEGKTLMVQYNDGKSEQVIDPDYTLGTPYNVRIVAAGGKVDVLYNGEQKAELPLSGSGWYWKVGAYVQSNPERGSAPDALGEVTVYSAKITHNGGSGGGSPTSPDDKADDKADDKDMSASGAKSGDDDY
jgi:hypothetical protein